MKELPTIQLDRLTLRPFSLKDAPAVKELAGDPYIAATTLYIPHPYEDGMAENWIKTHAVNYHEGRSLELAIVHTEEKYLIGAIYIGLIRCLITENLRIGLVNRTRIMDIVRKQQEGSLDMRLNN